MQMTGRSRAGPPLRQRPHPCRLRAPPGWAASRRAANQNALRRQIVLIRAPAPLLERRMARHCAPALWQADGNALLLCCRRAGQDLGPRTHAGADQHRLADCGKARPAGFLSRVAGASAMYEKRALLPSTICAVRPLQVLCEASNNRLMSQPSMQITGRSRATRRANPLARPPLRRRAHPRRLQASFRRRREFDGLREPECPAPLSCPKSRA